MDVPKQLEIRARISLEQSNGNPELASAAQNLVNALPLAEQHLREIVNPACKAFLAQVANDDTVGFSFENFKFENSEEEKFCDIAVSHPVEVDTGVVRLIAIRLYKKGKQRATSADAFVASVAYSLAEEEVVLVDRKGLWGASTYNDKIDTVKAVNIHEGLPYLMSNGLRALRARRSDDMRSAADIFGVNRS